MRRLRRSLARVRTYGSWNPRQVALVTLALVAGLALAVPVLRQGFGRLSLAAQDVVLAQVSALYDLSWHAIAGGGGKMESAQHTLHGTAGQALTGQASSGSHTLCSGFWCDDFSSAETPEDHWVYLPLVLRNTP